MTFFSYGAHGQMPESRPATRPEGRWGWKPGVQGSRAQAFYSSRCLCQGWRGGSSPSAQGVCHVCLCVHTCVCCVCLCVHAHVSVCMCVSLCPCMCLCVHAHMCTVTCSGDTLGLLAPRRRPSLEARDPWQKLEKLRPRGTECGPGSRRGHRGLLTLAARATELPPSPSASPFILLCSTLCIFISCLKSFLNKAGHK